MDQTALAKMLRKEVDKNLQYFSSLWDGFESSDNQEAPHRQRTTVNKLRGYAQFVGLSDKKSQAPGLHTMRTWQKELGSLRDLDVVQKWLETTRKPASHAGRRAAKTLRDYLQEQREARRQVIASEARGYRGAEVRLAVHQTAREFGLALNDLEKGKTNFDGSKALESVAQPWLEGLAKLETDQSDKLLHSFRVKNKKLRFVLEFLATYRAGTAYGDIIAERARLCSETHTCLGNLSDLLVLKDLIRLQRARWMAEGRRLDKSADAIEAARLEIEREEFRQWFSLWPVISKPDFLKPVLVK